MPDYPELTPEKALIFRITHRDNVPFILDHGLHCASSAIQDPSFVPIGKPGLIDARSTRRVPIPPDGTLADYVPFYFAPRGPMLGNIRFGQGVPQRSNEEIVFLVSSLHALKQRGVRFLFTDRHAALRTARFSVDLADLAWLPWAAFRACDFRRDPDNPEPFDCYQAEALAHTLVPLDALLGIACYSEAVKLALEQSIKYRGLSLATYVRAGWYIP